MVPDEMKPESAQSQETTLTLAQRVDELERSGRRATLVIVSLILSILAIVLAAIVLVME
jgi:predicted ATPase